MLVGGYVFALWCMTTSLNQLHNYMDTCFEHSICIVNGWIKILVIAERISACEANNWGKP